MECIQVNLHLKGNVSYLWQNPKHLFNIKCKKTPDKTKRGIWLVTPSLSEVKNSFSM